MDSVEFGGKTIIFFTLFSSCSESYNSKLYYCYNSDDAYSIDIGNSQDRNYQIKTVVFKNVLYVFYTSPSWASIRYRTATVNYGPAGTDWKLEFGGEKSMPAGPTTQLHFGAWMNDTMYVIYSSGSDWYYISSADGLAFGPATKFFTGGPIYGAGGAVFQVPDANVGSVEKLMISYANGSALRYFIFDGISSYGAHEVPVLTNTSPYSVRLVAGSAFGYSNSRYAIQVFYASPSDNTSQTWSSIYHREYYPAGANGDAGGWSTQWTRLAIDKDDTIKNADAYESDPCWAVVPTFTDEAPNTRMLIQIWYSRGTNYVWPSIDHVLFRRLTYESNLLVHGTPTITGADQQDLSSSTILGVIEGTPPFPVNGGVPTSDTYGVSTASFNVSTTLETRTAWSAGGGVLVSFGQSFLNKGSWSAKLSAGLKYTKDTKNQNTSITSLDFSSYADTTPGDLGWVLLLTPEIINNPYILKAWDGHCLGYGTDFCGDEFGVSSITYGDGTTIGYFPYHLVDPPAPFGTDENPAIFKGMAPRNVSSDVLYWKDTLDLNAPSYSGYLNEYKANPIPPVMGGLGATYASTTIATTSQAETWSPSAGFSVSTQKLGFISFGTEVNANFSMDIQTTTTMTKSLGFKYHLPKCPEPINYCCMASVTVQPWILIPNEDDSGYYAPWISDDIRNHKKPKPWSISYVATPDHDCSDTLSTTRLAVKLAQGTLLFDLGAWNRDQLKAHFIVTGITPNFALSGEELVRLWLGSYLVSTEKNYVISRYFRGRHLIIELSEAEDPASFIKVRLAYNKAQSQLDIQLDADRIDLSPLFAYSFMNENESSLRTTGTVPLVLHLGGRYYADTDLDVNCTFNSQNGKCSLQSKK
ncbi:MAG: hypothetical protein ACSLFH_00355 [Desulfuromonadales bacterium]